MSKWKDNLLQKGCIFRQRRQNQQTRQKKTAENERGNAIEHATEEALENAMGTR